jgi:hypothetical protein
MLLSEYIRNNDCEQYKYTGSGWGNYSEGFLSKENILELLDTCDFDGEIAEQHPIYGYRKYNKDGEIMGEYYLESNKIGWASQYQQEILLIEVSPEYKDFSEYDQNSSTLTRNK